MLIINSINAMLLVGGTGCNFHPHHYELAPLCFLKQGLCVVETHHGKNVTTNRPLELSNE